MSNREPRNLTTTERLKRGIAIGTLGILGATGLAACGPSNAGAEKSPTVATASATPSASETTTASPTSSPENTLGTIENANISSIFESPQFKALPAEQQARIKYIDTIDFTDPAAHADLQPGETANYVDLYYKVYGDYSVAMYKDAMVKDNQDTPENMDKFLAPYLEYTKNKGPNVDGDVLQKGHQLDLILLAYSMTEGGNSTVVDAKRHTAINVAILTDAFANQAGRIPYIDKSDSLVNRLQTITEVTNKTNPDNSIGGALASSATIHSTNEVRKGNIYKLTNIMMDVTEQTQYYTYIKSAEGNGYWKHYLSADQGEPLFVTDTQLANTAALQKADLG